VLPEVGARGLSDAVDAFCETIAFSPEETARVFEAAARHGLPVRLHADQLSDSGGAALAARHRALSADHLEYTSEAGVRAMAEAGTIAMLLPGAFYTLKQSQRPPIEAFRRHGVPMAIATWRVRSSACRPRRRSKASRPTRRERLALDRTAARLHSAGAPTSRPGGSNHRPKSFTGSGSVPSRSY
jgi:hypothetical protein